MNMRCKENLERERIEKPIGVHDKRFQDVLQLKEEKVPTYVNIG